MQRVWCQIRTMWKKVDLCMGAWHFSQIIGFESHLHGSLVDYVNSNPCVLMEFKPCLALCAEWCALTIVITVLNYWSCGLTKTIRSPNIPNLSLYEKLGFSCCLRYVTKDFFWSFSFTLRNRKHIPCFYWVTETPVEV